MSTRVAVPETAKKAIQEPAPAGLKARLGQWSQRSLTGMWAGSQDRTPPLVSEALRSSAFSLKAGDRDRVEARSGFDFSRVKVHTDGVASTSAERMGAAAYTAGEHIVFARGEYAPRSTEGRRLLHHELAHVAQGRGATSNSPTGLRREGGAEAEALRWESGSIPQVGNPGLATTGTVVRPSIAKKILQFAEKRLAKRVIKTVSKHIARHARQIAGRAIHSVFKNPKEIRSLLQIVVREATEVAAKHPTAGSVRMIEEAGIRITREATGTPGKFRLVIQKVFEKEIGTQGERVLRLVLDQTGRLVTAFPTDRLVAIGLTAAGITALSEGTARAGEAAQAQAEKSAAAEKKREDKVDLWDWVPFIGDIWGGNLNEGEDEMLRQGREIDALVNDVIKEVEETEKRTLGMKERKELSDIIRVAMVTPMILQDAEEGEP